MEAFLLQEEGTASLERVRNKPFVVTDVTAKKGTEAPPRLYDLTSLQVDCNKKFGYSAELSLQLVQGLYEKKYTTYPRVDTTYLSEDIYPQCPNILQGLQGYEAFTTLLRGKKLMKRKKCSTRPRLQTTMPSFRQDSPHTTFPTWKGMYMI